MFCFSPGTRLPEKGPTTGSIIGGIIGAIVLLAAIGTAIAMFRKHRSGKLGGEYVCGWLQPDCRGLSSALTTAVSHLCCSGPPKYKPPPPKKKTNTPPANKVSFCAEFASYKGTLEQGVGPPKCSEGSCDELGNSST